MAMIHTMTLSRNMKESKKMIKMIGTNMKPKKRRGKSGKRMEKK